MNKFTPKSRSEVVNGNICTYQYCLNLNQIPEANECLLKIINVDHDKPCYYYSKGIDFIAKRYY